MINIFTASRIVIVKKHVPKYSNYSSSFDIKENLTEKEKKLWNIFH